MPIAHESRSWAVRVMSISFGGFGWRLKTWSNSRVRGAPWIWEGLVDWSIDISVTRFGTASTFGAFRVAGYVGGLGAGTYFRILIVRFVLSVLSSKTIRTSPSDCSIHYLASARRRLSQRLRVSRLYYEEGHALRFGRINLLRKEVSASVWE
jgi:hypothetical protein